MGAWVDEGHQVPARGGEDMTCRCDELAARIAAIEARLGMTTPKQAALFDLPAEPEPAGTKYTAAFEKVWEKTGKHGGKFPAFKAWQRAKCPPWTAIAPGWTAYLRSDAPVRLNAVQHLSTWLNARGWEQDWPPARTASVRPIEPSRTSGPKYQPPQSSCFPHAENPRCHTKRITPGCPECKEQAAREAGRSMSEDEALEPPDWMAAAARS